MRGDKSYYLIIEGRVQMVGFRYFTKELARELGICGWVRNREDGRVETFIEGKEEALEKMMRYLREGPKGARVTHLERFHREVEGLGDFHIRY